MRLVHDLETENFPNQLCAFCLTLTLTWAGDHDQLLIVDFGPSGGMHISHRPCIMGERYLTVLVHTS
jgi:hypothetical protein